MFLWAKECVFDNSAETILLKVQYLFAESPKESESQLLKTFFSRKCLYGYIKCSFDNAAD